MAGAEVIGKIATLAFTVAAARILGEEAFGAFAYALSFSMLVAIVPTWGFGAVLVQRASAEPPLLRRLTSEAVVWRTILAIPAFAVAAVVGASLRPGGQWMATLLLVMVATFIELSSTTGRAVTNALQDQAGASKALIAQRLSAAVLAILALAVGMGIVGLAVAYLIGTVIGSTGIWLSVRRLGIRFDASTVSRAGMLDMLRRSVPYGINAITALTLFRVDQVLLGSLKGNAAVGIYAAAYRLLETVLFISWAVVKAVFPVMSGTTEGWKVRRAVEQSLAAMAAIYLPFAVGLWLEAEPLLRLLYGDGYAEAGSTVARWLAAAPLVYAVGYLGSFALAARRRSWLLVVATIVSAVVNVGMNLLLIPRLSGTGAAIATVVSYAVQAAMVLVFLGPDIGWVRAHRVLVVPVLASAVMGLVVWLAPLPVLVEVPIGAAVYGLAWLLLAGWLAPDQRAVLRSVLPGRRRRGAADGAGEVGDRQDGAEGGEGIAATEAAAGPILP